MFLVPLLIQLAVLCQAADEVPLAWRKTALTAEVDLVQASPQTYYLVVDGVSGEGYLKAGGRNLREFPIRRASLDALSGPGVFRLARRIAPGTPEPGNDGMRLRNRPLPLDFVGRLIEGPRKFTRLYFEPPLLVQSSALPVDPALPTLTLAGDDVKALASALEVGAHMILIPDIPETGR